MFHGVFRPIVVNYKLHLYFVIVLLMPRVVFMFAGAAREFERVRK
jgi:hypothetical protein